MKREFLRTADGSVTIHMPEWGESYHSKFGAIQEAYHVFIRAGLDAVAGNSVRILEMGFGTGLNCLVTYLEARRTGKEIEYTGIEAYPISAAEVAALNYTDVLEIPKDDDIFERMHNMEWEVQMELAPAFNLTKRSLHFDVVQYQEAFDLVYFDAFGYQVQPELWDGAMFKRMFEALAPGGILVTYAARGVVRRNMVAARFVVEKLAGPEGKREMLRAHKLSRPA